MTAYIYLRVSTVEQSRPGHVSLDVQEQVCRERCQRERWPVAAVLKDVESGLSDSRPNYQLLLRVPTGSRIVIYRLDRLGRDAADLLGALKSFRRRGVAVISATEPLENELLAGVLALLAEDESRRISQRVRPALAARIREGKWVNKAPLGYRLVKAPDERGRTLEPNEDAPKVARLFELYADGRHSLGDLRREAALMGLGGPQGLSRPYLRLILRNCVYVGQSVLGRRQRGVDGRVHLTARNTWQVAQGLHSAIVDPAVFDEVQRVLDRHQTAYGAVCRGGHLLTGLLRCRCGCRMSAHPAGKGSWKRYYYRCFQRAENRACDQPSLPAHWAEGLVKGEVAATFVITPGLRERAEEVIRLHRQEFLGEAAQRHDQLERAKAQHESDRRALALRHARGVIPEDVYLDLERQSRLVLSAIERELESLGQVEAPDIGRALALVSAITWEDLDAEGWREVANALIDHVEADGKKLTVVWAEGAAALARALRQVGVPYRQAVGDRGRCV